MRVGGVIHLVEAEVVCRRIGGGNDTSLKKNLNDMTSVWLALFSDCRNAVLWQIGGELLRPSHRPSLFPIFCQQSDFRHRVLSTTSHVRTSSPRQSHRPGIFNLSVITRFSVIACAE